MSLHGVGIFDKVYKWSPEKVVKIDKWPDLSHSFLPIDCCVRINGEPDRSALSILWMEMFARYKYLHYYYYYYLFSDSGDES